MSLTEQINQTFGENAKELTPELYAQIASQVRQRAHQELKGLPLVEAETGVFNAALQRILSVQVPVFRSREDFFRFAATVVRRLALDAIKAANRQKRGGECVVLSLEGLPEVHELTGERKKLAIEDLLEALSHLEDSDPQLHDVLVMKFFWGFSKKEIAEALKTSLKEVEGLLRTAYGVLRLQLQY